MLSEMVNRTDANRLDDEELGNALMWLDHRGHKQIADLLRAEYGFFEDEDGYVNGSLGTAGLARQLDLRCPGCGSQAIWLRSSDGKQWRCGNLDHIGFKFEVVGLGAERAKAWYAKYLEQRLRNSSLYGRAPEVGGLDDDDLDGEDPDDDLLDDDFPDAGDPTESSALHGQGFRQELLGSPSVHSDDPLGLANGPCDPGKFGR
jgi:hypothetical protein